MSLEAKQPLIRDGVPTPAPHTPGSVVVLFIEWPNDRALYQGGCEDCYYLNGCVPPNLQVEILTPKNDGIRM